MKILIAGDGKVGSVVSKTLSREGHDIVLIDMNNNALEMGAQKYDIMAVKGNCAAMHTLKQAGVESAELLIAVTSTDEINLLSCLTAHCMNPKLHTIARIRNPEYVEQAVTMKDEFALSLVVNPERQAAQEICNLIRYPGFLKRDTFAKGRVQIVELKVEENSPLCNISLMSLGQVIKCKVLVCAVLRDGKAIIPGGNFVLCADDKVFVTAPSDNIQTLLKSLNIITHKAKSVLVAGGGKDAYYLANELKNSGITLKIIEQDKDRCIQLASLLPGAEIIFGDASNQQLLEEEGIEDCDAVVSLTGIDEFNIIISLFAHTCKVEQVITKIGRIENSRMLDSLSLGSVVSPKDLCCNNIIRYVRALHNQVGAAKTVHRIADGHVEAAEFVVDDSVLHCGEKLKTLKLKKNVLVACISKGMITNIPDGDSTFEKGDSVIIVSSDEVEIRQLNDIFE